MKKVTLISLIIASSFIGCSRTATIYNIHETPLPPASLGRTHEEIRDIIVSAIAKRHWACHSTAYNVLRCSHSARGHEATVDIRYSPQSYFITHVSSSRMLQHKHKIHGKYNKWIRLMQRDIEAALSKPVNRRI